MKLKLGDQIMYEAEMMEVSAIGLNRRITLTWTDDDGEAHDFGPFEKSEYKEWPVL